jgi:predicted  nucleic acid-binding Zn-ribbon protein
MRIPLLALAIIMLGASGCSTVYYGTMESLGIHKRELMMDRVKDANKTQHDVKKQFVSAMQQFQSVVNFKGGNLEKEYNKLNATLKRSEAGAKAIRHRIKAIEDVSGALFKEWSKEIKQYSSKSLRKASQQKYDIAVADYKGLIQAMKLAESKLEPALVPLRDQVLFLKHNLNAEAISGLSDELVSIQTNVASLIRDMDVAIAHADKFVATLQK